MSEIYWDNPEFAVYYDQNCDHQYRKGRVLVEMMGITQGDVVLDVGCGTGQQAVTTSTIIGPSGSLTCIDPSTHCIELARKKFTGVSNHNVRFLVGKGENL